MKILHALIILVSLITILVACQSMQGETMVLLDEKITAVKIANSEGVGSMNEDILLTFEDNESIKLFKKAITTAKLQNKSEANMPTPDYDVMVEYGEDFPVHAIHLWFGEENEKSTLSYMIGEGETYVTSSKIAKQLRQLILDDSK